MRLPNRDLEDGAGDRELVPRAWLEGRFADWLRDRIGERGMTQRMLALRSGVDHSTISRLLDDDDRQPTLATALALLLVLGDEATPVEGLVRDRTG